MQSKKSMFLQWQIWHMTTFNMERPCCVYSDLVNSTCIEWIIFVCSVWPFVQFQYGQYELDDEELFINSSSSSNSYWPYWKMRKMRTWRKWLSAYTDHRQLIIVADLPFVVMNRLTPIHWQMSCSLLSPLMSTRDGYQRFNQTILLIHHTQKIKFWYKPSLLLNDTR